MLRRLLNLFRPNRLEAEIREELEYHRDRTSGAFGYYTAIQDQTREASTIVWLETLVQDVRYGLRQLARTPLVTVVAVLSLALGIGANTAIFTLIDNVMLQSLPVKEPGRLVLFYDGFATGTYSGDSLLPGGWSCANRCFWSPWDLPAASPWPLPEAAGSRVSSSASGPSTRGELAAPPCCWPPLRRSPAISPPAAPRASIHLPPYGTNSAAPAERNKIH